METKIVYRIENPEDKDGMWYTKDGILRKKIHILCPDGIAKDFPMPFNPIHKKTVIFGKVQERVLKI